MTNSEQLDMVFAALASPVRRAMLERLAEREATVNELAEPFDMTLPAVSKHIRVLEAAGLITKARKAQYRPCELNPKPLEALASWTDQCRCIWETRFDQMDHVLKTLKGKEGE